MIVKKGAVFNSLVGGGTLGKLSSFSVNKHEILAQIETSVSMDGLLEKSYLMNAWETIGFL